MWLNNIRVRRLAQKTIGTDLADAIFGIDQKGIHMNEHGSKTAKTLAIKGCKEVPLIADHAATRSRLSIMTVVTSNKNLASARKLHLELLIKAKTGRKLSSIKLPKDLVMTLQYAEKGSYRAANVTGLNTHVLVLCSE